MLNVRALLVTVIREQSLWNICVRSENYIVPISI